jgi:hypothetical protein
MPKADLTDALASAGGSRRKAREPEPQESATQPSRVGTRPITAHFPPEVRDQLKILAIEQRTTMHKLIAEAYNDLFAKYGKPEIAPIDRDE